MSTILRDKEFLVELSFTTTIRAFDQRDADDIARDIKKRLTTGKDIPYLSSIMTVKKIQATPKDKAPNE